MPVASAFSLLAADSPGGGRFVEIDVHIWAWIGLTALLLTCSGSISTATARTTAHDAGGVDRVGHLGGLRPRVLRSSIARLQRRRRFGEYISGYLIEKSLSVDNVFVWAMLFTAMAIPLKFQHRVLFWGIFGALTLRAIFIFAGTALISRFWWLLLVFGVFLVYTGIKVIRHRADEGDEEATARARPARRFMPVTDRVRRPQVHHPASTASGRPRRCSPRWWWWR